MTNINEIKYIDWQPKINSIGEVVEGADDINQCIAIILMTHKGSVPHRPKFGSNLYKYLDYPIDEAIPNIIREITDSLTLWEKRIKINSVNCTYINEHITVRIEWTLSDNTAKGSTEVIL